MSHTATIRFAPVHTFERHNDPRWNRPGRCLYTSGSLKFMPGVSEVPLLVDHKKDRQVGTVDMIWKGEWVDGPWYFARAAIDKPPAWLRKCDTKASFGLLPYERRTYTEGELLAGALVTEISILSPGTLPAEPLACVERLARTEAPKPAAARPAVLKRTAYQLDDEELRRRLDYVAARGLNVDFELVLENLRHEIAGGRELDALWAQHFGRKAA